MFQQNCNTMQIKNQTSEVSSSSKDQRNAKDLEVILQSFDRIKELTLEEILLRFQLCNSLREDVTFLRNLFDYHPEIILEMIQWLFNPEKILKRKTKKLPSGPNQFRNVRLFPYLCFQFINQNIPFYEEMHRASRAQSIPIGLWFNFLLSQDFDEDKASTSLGYFKEIFLQFAINEYHHPVNRFQMNLCESASFGKATQSLILNKYSVLGIFSDSLINDLLKISYIQSVFLFLTRLAVVGLCDKNYSKKAESILTKIFEKACKNDRVLQNMCIFSEQILSNIERQRFNKGAIILLKIIETKLVKNSVERIIKSELFIKQKIWDEDEEKDKQEEAVQNNLKFLVIILKVYKKIAKQNINNNFQGKEYQQENNQEQSTRTSREQGFYISQILKVSHQLRMEVKYIFGNLLTLNNLIIFKQNSPIKFSNGQNVDPITLVKFAYLDLLHNCVEISVNDKNYSIKINEVSLFLTISKCLSQNKWNNIAQRILQKIAGLLIVNNYHFFKKFNVIQKNQVANNFIGFLIENFVNKDYVFLNSLKMTNFGHLHCIYKIAKTVAYELQKSNKLLPLIQSFEPWKKFLLHDLKEYEERITRSTLKQPSTKIQDEIKIQIDEAQPLKKLLSKVKQRQKWLNKFTKNCPELILNTESKHLKTIRAKKNSDNQQIITINKDRQLSSKEVQKIMENLDKRLKKLLDD